MVWLPLAKATGQKAVVWLPLAKARRMMEKPFNVRILTPDKKIFEGSVVSLVVKAFLGYLGVLADHAPLIASLVPGKIIYRDNQGAQAVINNSGRGFIEVANNNVVILLDK